MICNFLLVALVLTSLSVRNGLPTTSVVSAFSIHQRQRGRPPPVRRLTGSTSRKAQPTSWLQSSSFIVEPPLLLDGHGREIATLDGWQRRRQELLELFRTHVYGRIPDTGVPYHMPFSEKVITRQALNGIATLLQVTFTIQTQKGSLSWEVPLLIPNDKRNRQQKVPLFLLICNTCRPGPRVDPLQPCSFWPTDEIIKAGFATASFYNGDIAPDDGRDDHRNGIHALFDGPYRPKDAWGAIGAWAWGASRVLDYLVECQSDVIDTNQVAIVGHSRGGKTALWAAAQDERFAMAISNNSGCTGASLARHDAVGAETIAQINKRFPHWFCRNYRKYNNNINALPVDQHMLLALLAPRALHVASATHDFWADPVGEYLATCEASQIWTQVYGKDTSTTTSSFAPTDKPQPNQCIRSASSNVAYHLRMGEHDLCLYDWQQYITTAKEVFAKT